MNIQETKAVKEYAKKASQIDTLIISNSLNESIKAYGEGVHNGILMGAQFLDTLRKPSEPEANVCEAGEGLVEKIELILNENRETDRFNRTALDWSNFHYVATEIAALMQPDKELLGALKKISESPDGLMYDNDGVLTYTHYYAKEIISNYEKQSNINF